LLLEILEFVTGKPADFDWSCFEDWASLITYYKDLNESRNRPARDLGMPPAWPDVGFYAIISENGQLFMKKQIGVPSTIVKIPAEVLPFPGPPGRFSVAKNFSESGAEVVREGEPGALKCIEIIPLQVSVPVVAGKRRALALTDGARPLALADSAARALTDDPAFALTDVEENDTKKPRTAIYRGPSSQG
jgi:hypothetical protein